MTTYTYIVNFMKMQPTVLKLYGFEQKLIKINKK